MKKFLTAFALLTPLVVNAQIDSARTIFGYEVLHWGEGEPLTQAYYRSISKMEKDTTEVLAEFRFSLSLDKRGQRKRACLCVVELTVSHETIRLYGEPRPLVHSSATNMYGSGVPAIKLPCDTCQSGWLFSFTSLDTYFNIPGRPMQIENTQFAIGYVLYDRSCWSRKRKPLQAGTIDFVLPEE